MGLGVLMKSSLIIVLLMCLFVGCTSIGPGKVGILVYQNGSQKGVQDYPIKTGRIFYNPLTTTVYDYPTYMQNALWQGAERICFNTAEGSRVSVDVALSYTLNKDKVPSIFVKHRAELDIITHNYLRNKVRDSINKHSAQYHAVEALSSKSQEIVQEAKSELTKELEPEGFEIDTLSFVSAPDPEDPQVKQSISLVISSTQKALEAENKVKQIEAEAKQALAKAEGEAKSITELAKAQAEANKILSESITPELVKYKMIEVWDGKMPQVIGSNADILMSLGK
jgi:regulator of protease activity HflC (stomatin/prohibitin superfamily)